MLLKSSQKLFVTQGHFLLFVAVFVILVAESNIGIGDIENTMRGNGYFVRVSSQIFKHLLRSSKWAFGVHIPLDVTHFMEDFFKSCLIFNL